MFIVIDLFEIKFKRLYIKLDGKTEYGDSLGLLSFLPHSQKFKYVKNFLDKKK